MSLAAVAPLESVTVSRTPKVPAPLVATVAVGALVALVNWAMVAPPVMAQA
jgi:hypothetical protein